jgi:hypothetical protein
VIGNYSCGKVEVWYPSQPGRFKKWPSFPPDCAVKEVLPLPKEEVDVTDRLDWMSGFIFGTLRTGFVVTLVFFVVAAAIWWCVVKRWLKRKRWQSAENRGKEQRGDGIGHTKLYYINILGCDFEQPLTHKQPKSSHEQSLAEPEFFLGTLFDR